MNFGAMFLWAGLGLPFVSSVALSRLKSKGKAFIVRRSAISNRAAAIGSSVESAWVPSLAGTVNGTRLPVQELKKGWRLVHSIRHGSIEIIVWQGEKGPFADHRHSVTFSRNQDASEHGSNGSTGYGVRDCFQLITCMGEAISWIQREERSAG